MSRPFATVDAHNKHLCIRVRQPACADNDFYDFADHVAETYVTMPHGFVLSIDMMAMERLPLNQALKWMTMFHKVADVTRERLVATCICFDDPLIKISTDLFLTLYNPIKPLHVFDSADACKLKVEQLLERLTNRDAQTKP